MEKQKQKYADLLLELGNAKLNNNMLPQLHETFDKDGVKRYEETILFISESDPRVNNSIKDRFGQHFIRLNKSIKYNENGKIAWQLVYDDNGKVIQNQSFSNH